MAKIVDFHVHVYQDNLSQWISKAPLLSTGARETVGVRLDGLRKQVRHWMKPVAGSLHDLQTTLRYLPETARKALDEVGSLTPIPGLFVESTVRDLQEAMNAGGVDSAVVIAHPPFIENEFILETCQENPHLIPAVNISKKAVKPGRVLHSYASKGAKILKIHPSADGEGAESPRYRALLRAAADLGLPVILHTGCFHSSLFYKDPTRSSAECFTKWYETYPSIKFVLAHMNFHEPQTALDLCEEFPNLYVDTSWQPAELISEAVRQIGAERVLFGSDWPLVGNNMSVGLKRIQECVDTGLLNETQSRHILGENALNLLGMSQENAAGSNSN